MISVAQLNANRLNAQHSTGPRTEAGKSVSRFNALKYGAEARSLVLPSEDPAELVTLALEYHQQFNPVGPLEDYLVQTIVQADWMRRRYTLVESLIVQDRIGNPDYTSLYAFTCPAAMQISRRLAAEDRSYFRAWKELRRAQQEWLANEEAEAKSPAADCRPQLPAVVVAEPQIGFVPSNPPQQAARSSKPPVSAHRGAFRGF